MQVCTTPCGLCGGSLAVANWSRVGAEDVAACDRMRPGFKNRAGRELGATLG